MNIEIGRQDAIAWAKAHLATIEERSGDIELALQWAKEAREIYRRLGMRGEIENTQALVKRLEGKLATD